MPRTRKPSAADAVVGAKTFNAESQDASSARGPLAISETADALAMAKYGITMSPVEYFHLGRYRYTNLQDAIAQAKRTGSRQVP